MSTNAEVRTETSRKQLLRPGRSVITIIQLITFVISLVFIVYYRWSRMSVVSNISETKNILEFLLHSLVVSPLAVFLGTVLLIKGLQFLYKKKSGEIGFIELRTVLFAISLIAIVLFAVCVLYVFMHFVVNGFSISVYNNLTQDTLRQRILDIIPYYHVIFGSITGICFMAKNA